MAHSVTFVYAFLAGLLSFLSPCVLPLVPGYISMLSGTVAGEDPLAPARALAVAAVPATVAAGGGEAWSTPVLEPAAVFVPARGARARRAWQSSSLLRHAIFFVLGFSAVFIGLGAAATSVGQLLRTYQVVLSEVGGIIVILFGLHFLGVIKIGVLYSDKRLRAQKFGATSVGAFAIGFAFAFGWTPCIGPILGTILILAAGQRTADQGVWLLVIYSLGLAVPFLLTALALDRFANFYKGFRRHLHLVEVISGVLLVLIGALLLTHQMTLLSGYLAQVPFLNKLVL